jgi:CheY-like chemotaxis protein
MSHKVLLVDDEDAILRLLELTMSNDSRYSLLLAKDGETAVELARREKPTVIFLDVLMPGIDGFQVCQTLKSDPETESSKVIILTALAQDFDRRKAEEVGADGFFTKPFSPAALLEKLDEVLGNSSG